MSPSDFRVRRATVDDLPTLKVLWEAMRFSVADLEKRLTEFQVAEGPDGKVVGALCLQIGQRHGWFHSEAFADFAVADLVRPLLWTRIQSLAMNHGLVRLWTRENAPFWTHNGLQPAEAEALQRLPEMWGRATPGWLTLRLKDEEVIASLDKEFDMFVASEKQRTADALGQAQRIKAVLTAVGFVIALLIAVVTLYMMLKQTRGAAPLPH